VAYTKKIGSFAKVTIDGTDVSNSFRPFGRPSEDDQVDVSGFSTTGVDEFLPGGRNQRFEGEAFYTEELATIAEPLYKNRTTCVISWQPDGLVDATREIYTGNCYINTWEPGDTFGDVSTMNFSASAADSTGITATDFT
jgi:hypothetical protein